jgi:hypothetical protein
MPMGKKERMNEWMNEWMIEWVNEWMNEWMNYKESRVPGSEKSALKFTFLSS